jgi:hypothetical protein
MPGNKGLHDSKVLANITYAFFFVTQKLQNLQPDAD